MSPGLYLLGTPIGNPLDFSPHAHSVLQNADFIIGEEFKTTSTFLKMHGIAKEFEVCNEHSSEVDLHNLLRGIETHRISCLISDGGMPLIEDPGRELVRMCIEKKIDIKVIPGMSAFLVALLLSGFPTTPFTFCGFLPRETPDRKKAFHKFLSIGSTLVFYETPYRYKKAFSEILGEISGETPVFLGIDLTSEREIKHYSTAKALRYSLFEFPKGNPVLVLPSRNLRKT